MPWLCIYTNAKQEALADRCLREQGNETLFLRYRDTVRHARRETTVLRPYFPRYLFVRPAEALYTVGKTRGVSSVVCSRAGPLEVPEDVIESLHARSTGDGLVEMTEEQRKRFKENERLMINDGPFANLIATVSVDAGSKIQVWLELFNGRVPAEVSPESVSPVSAARGR